MRPRLKENLRRLLEQGPLELLHRDVVDPVTSATITARKVGDTQKTSLGQIFKRNEERLAES